jgi:cyclopropane fatty-acyl-phospholipid synthase-like methyltransferase
MKIDALTVTDIDVVAAPAPTKAPPPSVVSYYRETTNDYRAWSRNLNMHFGYWRRGLSPFDREGMVDEMTAQVLARLERLSRLADLGCGAGAPAAYVLRARPALRLDGVTLLPEQVELARAAAHRHGIDGRAAFHVMDYTATRFPDGAFDGAMAIESSCHAPGGDKRAFVREAARLLAPGGRLVVADGFLKRGGPLRGFARWVLGAIARNWAVPEFAHLGDFRRALADAGFVDVVVEEISWNLAPSVLHIPIVTARVLLSYLFRRDLRIGRVRWGHVLGSVLAPLAGLLRRDFGYYLISARRR